MSNVGIYNNNWKGGRRLDDLFSEKLTEREILVVKLEVARDVLANIPTGQFADFRARSVKQLAAAEKAFADFDAQAEPVIPEHQSSERLYRTFDDMDRLEKARAIALPGGRLRSYASYNDPHRATPLSAEEVDSDLLG